MQDLEGRGLGGTRRSGYLRSLNLKSSMSSAGSAKEIHPGKRNGNSDRGIIGWEIKKRSYKQPLPSRGLIKILD